MGGVVHGREAVAPGALAVFEIEGFEAGVVVLAFAGVEVAEGAIVVEFAGGNGELLVVACFGHHVGEAGALHLGDELGALFERHGGGDSGEDMLAGAESLDGVADVIGRGGEEADGFDLFVLEKIVEGVVGGGAVVGFHERGAAVGAEVGHGVDHSVGMFVEIERGAEAAADNAHAEFTALGGDGQEGRGEERAAGEHHLTDHNGLCMTARALYVAFDVYPRPKGSSSHIASMVAALARDYAPVCVLCLGDGELPLREAFAGGEIYRLPGTQRDVLGRATAFAQFVEGHAARLAGRLRLLVYRDPWGGVPAMRGAPACPAIFEVNALPSWELAYSRPGFAESATLRAKLGDMERHCLRMAGTVLCVSEVTRRALGCEEKSVVVRNAASATYFEPGVCGLEVLASGEWCGYVGGLQAWQGVEFLVDAFAMTGRGRLLIVHSGNRGTRELARRIGRLRLGERVVLQGPLGAEELAGVMARLRFTVAPLAETARNTWQGCCPVKIVESMATGTPVIASDLAVSRELITHGLDGWLVTAGDRRAWALGMERLFRDGALRDTLAANAKRTAGEKFSQPIAHEELSRVFRRIECRSR